MHYSSLVNRIVGNGYNAWSMHGKGRALQAQGENVILLTIGDPDHDTPEPISTAAIQSIQRGRTHYTPLLGEPKLRSAVAAYHARTTGQQVTADNVAIVQGAQCGLFVAAMCVLQTGDEVIAPEPRYSTYEPVVGASGATLIDIPLRSELDFHFDPADLQRAVTPRTRAILHTSPHNPTGVMLGPEELEALAELSMRHDIWLITDEVYSSLAYERPHLSPASIPALADRTITISSLSKSHAMTGWRIGWVVGPHEFINHAGNLLACMLYGLPPFIQDGALEALTSSLAAMERFKTETRARRDLVCNALAGLPKLICRKPEGGMYVMLDVRATGLSSFEFAERLLDQQRVALLPGEGFGRNLAGHLRLSLTVSEELLTDACERIRRFVLSEHCLSQ